MDWMASTLRFLGKTALNLEIWISPTVEVRLFAPPPTLRHFHAKSGVRFPPLFLDGESARAESQGLDVRNADVELDADNDGADLNVHLVANAGSSSIRSVEATKGLDVNGARVTVTPRFNLEDDSQDVVVNYNNDNTNVKLTASVDNQEVTISQQLDDNNRVAPTINNNGDLSVEWERKLSDDSSLTANLKPNDNLNVEWKDAAWTANINMPIEGANINGANVSIKRDVNF